MQKKQSADQLKPSTESILFNKSKLSRSYFVFFLFALMVLGASYESHGFSFFRALISIAQTNKKSFFL